MKDMSTVELGNLVSVSEAAAILAARGISRTASAIKGYCQRELLPAKKIGKTWMIDRESLSEFDPPPQGNPTFGPGFRKKLQTCH